MSPRRLVVGTSPGFLHTRRRTRSRGTSVIQFFARKESDPSDDEVVDEGLDEDAEYLGPLVAVDPYSEPLAFLRSMRGWKKKARKEVPVVALIGGFKTAELRALSDLGRSDYLQRRSTFVTTACVTSAQDPLRSSFQFSNALCAFENMPTAGQAYLCGYFHLNKASSTIARLRVLTGRAEAPDAGAFVRDISKRDEDDALERPRHLNLRSPVIHLACGDESIALVPSSGGLFFSCADSPAGPLAFGSANKPGGWPGGFFTSLIAGQSIAFITCGPFHSAVVTSRGLVVVWGCNSYLASDHLVVSGQCCSAEANAFVCPPTLVPLPSTVYSKGQVISVACGQAHTVVVTSVGTYAFGDNRRSQLGVAELESTSVPILIPESEDWYCREVACGAFHNVALLGSGKLITWGLNSYGQCGYSVAKGSISSPTKHSFSEAIMAVSASGNHSAAVTLRGHVYCWGSNCYGESGSSDATSAVPSISMVPLAEQFGACALTVSCGPYSTAVTTASGEVYAWGLLCGYNMVTNQYAPRHLARLSHDGKFVSRVACGTSHIACLVDEELTAQLTIIEAALSGVGVYSSLYLKLTFLSLKTPQFLMGAVQDRAIRNLLSRDPDIPAVTALRAFRQLHCEDVDSNTATFKVTNISKRPLRLTVIHHSPEEYEGVFLTSFSSVGGDLAPAGVFSLRVTVAPKRLLHKEMTVLIELQTAALGSASGCAKYFLMLYVTPGETDVICASEMQDSRSSAARSIAAMRSFVPNTLLWWVHAKPKPLRLQPRFEAFEAAVLFLDISGFTNLTARLAQLGDAGPDFLSKHLNSYFGTLISVVEGHGGDLVKSAGDAIMFVFGKPWTLFGALPRKRPPPSTLARSCAQAVNCALQIQTSGLAEYDSKDGFTLTLHVAIGAGELAYMLVGGVNHTWEYVVSGSPLKQLASALTHSDQGEVVVSPECYKYVRSECTATQRGTDWAITSFIPAPNAQPERKARPPGDPRRSQGTSRARKLEMMAPEQRLAYVDNMRRQHRRKRAKQPSRLAEMQGSASSVTLPHSDSNVSVASESVAEQESIPVANVVSSGLTRPQLEPSAIDLLRSFVRPAIQYQAETAHSDTLQWVDELRTVTSLFVKLLTIDRADVDALQWEAYCKLIHGAVAVVQRELFNLEGVFCQFLQDDKGTILFAAFGLPPYAHADDANRGVLAALAIHRSLAETGVEASIGVGTGPVFTGVVGNSARCEYTVLGDSVNMTARIMGVALKKDVPILCDQATFERCQHSVTFKELEPVKVKGKDELVAIFAPIERKHLEGGGTLVGRKKEKMLLARAVLKAFEETLHVRCIYLASVNARVSSRTILIEAPSGMGKHMCATYAVSLCKSLGARICTYDCEAVNMLKPYHAMRALLNDLLLGGGSADKHQLLNSIKSSLPSAVAGDVALLKPMLDLPFQERNLREVRGLSGSARAKRTAAVVRSILQLVSCQTMLVFVIGDVQWMDPSSIGVMQETASHVGCLVILTAKELSTRARENLNPILSLKGTRKLFLGPLSEKKTIALACEKMGVKALPSDVKQMFLEVHGNPMYCTELALRLKNDPNVVVEEGELQLAGPLNIELPKTMKGVISSRIDLLPVHAQTVLKVAAAIGQVFTVADIAAVSGSMDEDSDLLSNSLEFLVLQDLLLPLDELRTRFTFRKDIIASVAYGRVMVSRRQELHFRAIEWFSDPENVTEDTVSVLAYHYGCALLDMIDPAPEVLLKAADYMFLSAERAREAFATKEATVFLQHAMDCLHRLPAGHSAKRSRTNAMKLKLIGLPMRDLKEFSLEEEKNSANVLRKSTLLSSGALPMRSHSRPEFSVSRQNELQEGQGVHQGALGILRGTKIVPRTFALDEDSGLLKIRGGKREVEVNARQCAFVDRSKPSAGQYNMRIIPKAGTVIEVVATTNAQHREVLSICQRLSWIGSADIDEKRFRLAATIYMTAAGKVVRIHPQACHLLRLQQATVIRQQIRSFMSRSSAKRFLKRISKARKNQNPGLMDKPTVLELNKVKVFVSLMDVFVGSRRNILMLLHRWRPMHPDLEALSQAVLEEGEDEDEDGDDDDDDDTFVEDECYEEVQDATDSEELEQEEKE